MIDQTIIDEAAQLLLEAAPRAKVYLFGSYARGNAGPDSDLDFLVVEPEVANPYEEMVRLREVLEPILGPRLLSADVLVVSADRYNLWKDTPNTVINEAINEGRVYERVA